MKKQKMTVSDVLLEMRARGLNISQKTFYDGIEKGVFPFVNILGFGETGRRNLLILRKDFETWAAEYLSA